MSDFDGYRFTVITRSGADFTVTHLDVPITDLPVGNVEDVLPAGNRSALVRCDNQIATLTWSGENLAVGAFALLWADDYSWAGGAAVSGDRTILAIASTPTGGGDTVLRFYTVVAGVVDAADPRILPFGADLSYGVFCRALGDNEFLVHRVDDDTVRRVIVTGGTPAWVGDAITVTSDTALHAIPGSRTGILARFVEFGEVELTAIDLDTGATGDVPLAVAYLGTIGSLAGAVALGISYTTTAEDIDTAALHVIRPASVDGLDLDFVGAPRPFALVPLGGGWVGSNTLVWTIGAGCLVGTAKAARTDYHTYRPHDGVDYHLADLTLVAQAVGYLDGSGHQVLDVMEPATDASQLWDVEYVVPLEVAEDPNMSASFRDARNAFYPI